MQASNIPVRFGGSPGPRLLFALGLSLALHAGLLAAFRVPLPPSRDADKYLHALLLQLAPGTSPAGPAEKGERAALPDPVRQAAVPPPRPAAKHDSPRPDDTGRASQPSHNERVSEMPSRLLQAFVSGGPAVAPVVPLDSGLSDGESYLGEAALSRVAEFPRDLQVEYPQAAYSRGRQGKVYVEVWIDAEGNPVQVRSMPDSDEEFAAAAIAGLRKSRFRPAEQNGKPVRSRAYFVLHFVLE